MTQLTKWKVKLESWVSKVSLKKRYNVIQAFFERKKTIEKVLTVTEQTPATNHLTTLKVNNNAQSDISTKKNQVWSTFKNFEHGKKNIWSTKRK